jgi:broad specificity phosphatase PhoE
MTNELDNVIIMHQRLRRARRTADILANALAVAVCIIIGQLLYAATK